MDVWTRDWIGGTRYPYAWRPTMRRRLGKQLTRLLIEPLTRLDGAIVGAEVANHGISDSGYGLCLVISRLKEGLHQALNLWRTGGLSPHL